MAISRDAALTSPGNQASEVYNKVVDSLDKLKGKVQESNKTCFTALWL